MDTLPPQSPPVFRDSLARRAPDEPAGGQGAAGLQDFGGVQSSQSQCDHLTGPAQSLCYAALYGVRV